MFINFGIQQSNIKIRIISKIETDKFYKIFHFFFSIYLMNLVNYYLSIQNLKLSLTKVLTFHQQSKIESKNLRKMGCEISFEEKLEFESVEDNNPSTFANIRRTSY